MTALIRCLTASSLSLAMMTPADDDAQKQADADVKRLQGEWVCVREETNGERKSDDYVKTMDKRMVVKGAKSTMTLDFQGKRQTNEGRFELNTATQPRQINWSGKDSQGASIKVEGIYKVGDDLFVLCYTQVIPGRKRPTEFETASKSGYILDEFRRPKSP